MKAYRATWARQGRFFPCRHIFMRGKYHGHNPHPDLSQIFKKCWVLNQKIKMLRKNKASLCKNSDVLYPHLVIWLSVFK